MILTDLPTAWRARADDLAPFAGSAAEAFRRAAAELEGAIGEALDAELTLSEAAKESGYSERRLREFLADGTIPQAGRRHRPRIRRGDLPRRAGAVRETTSSGYDPTADAAAILRGGR